MLRLRSAAPSIQDKCTVLNLERFVVQNTKSNFYCMQQPASDIEAASASQEPCDDSVRHIDASKLPPALLCVQRHAARVDRLSLLVFSASFVLVFGSLSLWHARRAKGGGGGDAGYAVADPDSCGSDEDRVFNAFEFAVARGAYIHYNVTTRLFPLPGGPAGATVRGLAARGEIREGATLFAVPPKLFMSLAALSRDPALRDVYNATPQLHDGFGGLAL